jgi:hypothetical protein
VEGIGIAMIRGVVLGLMRTKEKPSQNGRSFGQDSNWEPPPLLSSA